MSIDSSNPLFLIGLGMVLGALALYVILQIGAFLARARRRSADASGERGRVLNHTAPIVELKPPPVPESYYLWMNLTAREKEVAELAAQGKTNGEIADELQISPYTVGTHLKHIFHKLAINSRQQLAHVTRQVDDRDLPRA